MTEIWTYTPYDIREWNALHSKGDVLGILKLERAQYVWRDPYAHIKKDAWRAIDAMTEAKYGKKFVEDRRVDSLANQARLQAIVDRLDNEIKEMEECQMP